MRRGIFVFLFLCIVLSSTLISAKPPATTEFIGDTNLVIEANVMEYYKINEGAMLFIHVFNKTDGKKLTNATVDCDVELTNYNGTVVLIGDPTWDDEHWVMSRPANIVTERGKYALLIHCNASSTDGYKTFFFQANGFGDELDIAHSIKFNSAMAFLLVFLLLFISGVFMFDNVIGKFTCYFLAHMLFIGGTFSMWQFNLGYTTQYLGMAGIWKVWFYFSTIALLPAIIGSIALMIIVFAKDKEIQGLIDRGSTEEDAVERVGRSK